MGLVGVGNQTRLLLLINIYDDIWCMINLWKVFLAGSNRNTTVMSWSKKLAILCRSVPSSNLNELHTFTVGNVHGYKQILEQRCVANGKGSFVIVMKMRQRDFWSRGHSSCTHSLKPSNSFRLNQDTILRRAYKKDKQSSKRNSKVSRKERLREARRRNYRADRDTEENKAPLHHSGNSANTDVDSSKLLSLPGSALPEAIRDLEQHGCNERHAALHCEVEIVSWRERRISASICVEATEDRVWNVLTDYERLAEFIPNLVCSERIPCPHPGRIWLHQRGIHSAMYWHIEASVVLDLQEFPHSAEGKELHFSMVDGDFKLYAGRWFLQPGSRPGTTILHYEVNVIPRLLFPAAFVEKIIKADLPVNLCALAERAEADPAAWGMPTKILKSIAAMSLTPSPSLFTKTSGDPSVKAAFHDHQGSSKFSSKKMSLDIPASVVMQDKRLNPVPAYSQKINRLGVLVADDKKWSGTKRTYKATKSFCVDEVHLRRLNDPLTSGQHWRVITAITVEAPTEDVWAVLTAYENLPEFIPNLSQSKVLYREENHVRILQEGCKCLLYMVLHARVVLDLFENPKFEITFQQVEGDFDSFHGRWTLDALGNQHTLLKYVVDMKMHKDFLLPETIVEEVVYEDLPENLCAIRDRVELVQASFRVSEKSYKQAYEGSEDSNDNANAPKSAVLENDNYVNQDTDTCALKLSKRRKTPIAGLQRDFRVLEKELLRFIAENGKPGVMPMRWELRRYGRIDLEKAIARMGGFIRVAARLGLSLTYKQRKPKGYWDNLENIREEILLFQKDNGEETTIMPTRRSLEKAGRFDVARALEKWGGLLEVAQMLGLKTRRRATFSRDKLLETEEMTTHDTCGRKTPLKMSFPAKSLKWLNIRRDTRS